MWTTDELRERFAKQYENDLVMTNNELEELIKLYYPNGYLTILTEMWSRSERNAESIHSARISYGKY